MFLLPKSGWGFGSPLSGPDEDSLKARKTLCLASLKGNQRLNLKKATIQTIIKKQKHYRTSKTLLNQKDLFKHGLCGRTVDMKRENSGFSFKCEISLSESNRYRQMLLSCRKIETLSSQAENLSSHLFGSIEAVRTLQGLQLVLSAPLFVKLPRVLQALSCLKGLNLTLKSEEGENQDNKITDKRMERAVFQFSQALLTRKHLTSLKLQIEAEKFFGTKESGIHLLQTIGLLNLSSLRLNLTVSEMIISEPNRIQALLEKVEYLYFKNQNFFVPPLMSINKVLIFVGEPVPKLYDLVAHCSSLKKLDFIFPPDVHIDNIPSTLGQAKGITQLRIDYPHNDDSAKTHKLKQFISEASQLDTLTLSINHLEEEIGLIHDHLQHSKLQNYSLNFYSSKETLKTDTLSFKELCQKIGNIHSLTNLKVICEYVDDGKSFEPILTNLTNLKDLHISASPLEGDSLDLSWECLDSLHLLEELTIEVPNFEKDDILSRLPKMPNLKTLRIRATQNFPNRIDLSDYKSKHWE